MPARGETSGNVPTAGDVSPLWERLASDDPAMADKAAEEYRLFQETIVGTLVQILRDYDKKGTGRVDDAAHKRIDQISRVIYLLGETRSEAAVPVLTEFLVFNSRTIQECGPTSGG